MVVTIVVVLVGSSCVVDGTWTPVAVVPGGPTRLDDVSCVSDAWCLTIGDNRVVQVWDGTSWSSRPDLRPEGRPLRVGGLGCFAVDRCLVWGHELIGSQEVEVLRHWDGSTWADSPVGGLPVDEDPTLLACGSDGCVVHDSNSRMVTWDGSGYEVVNIVIQGAAAIACVTTSDCLGIRSDETVHWDGADWTSIDAPPVLHQEGALLSCPASTARCVSVGRSSVTGTAVSAMVYDGSAWSETALPTGFVGRFDALSCVASLECVALTSIWGAPGVQASAFLTFNSEAWFNAPTQPGGIETRYTNISCSGRTCLAVGLVNPQPWTPAAASYHWTYP